MNIRTLYKKANIIVPDLNCKITYNKKIYKSQFSYYSNIFNKTIILGFKLSKNDILKSKISIDIYEIYLKNIYYSFKKKLIEIAIEILEENNKEPYELYITPTFDLNIKLKDIENELLKQNILQEKINASRKG